jgi:hypothetical protein
MNMSELDARIRERAYAIWEQTGRPEGRERQHWEQAARELLASGRAESAGKVEKPAAQPKRTAAKGRTRKAA